MLPRSRIPERPVQTRARAVRLGVGLAALAWLLRKIIRVVVLVGRTPPALITCGILVGLAWLALVVGVTSTLAAVGLVQAALISWWRQWRGSFNRWVGRPLCSWARDWLVYRPCWGSAMNAAGLTHRWQGHEYAPALLRVTATRSVDRVRVQMLPGQTIEDYAEQASGLAQTFGAQICRVHSVVGRVHEVELWLLIRDPLGSAVDPLPATVEALSVGLPVAVAEDGSVWRLGLVGSHVLVVGATGAGKGSVIWSLLLQLTPHIRAGLVQVWAVDPKGGMELAAGRP
jgi:DNA segregation ATPase FtsK/SpoIIIE, S-DNA-T family